MSDAQGPLVDPDNPSDETSFLASQATWSATNLPAILGRLDPPLGWSTAPRPKQLVENGKKVFRGSKPILDYDIPRYIASPAKLETWRLEAWFRVHRGLSYDDIWARQPNWVPKPTNTQKNALNQRRLRDVRKPFNARAWIPNPRCPGVSKVMLEVVERLTQKEIDQNTNWKVVTNGIQQPNNTARLLPLGTFLTNGQTHTPSDKVADAVVELQRLRILARSHGKDHWNELPDNILPKTWTMRLQKSRRRPSRAASSVEENPTRGKTSKEREDDCESTGSHDDTSGPSLADSNKKTWDQKAALVTCSFVDDKKQPNLDDEDDVSNSSALTVFNSGRTIAADVTRSFIKVQTDFQEAEASVEADNTNLSRLTHLPSASPFPQHQLHLPQSAERSFTPINTLPVGAVGVNHREAQSSTHTRTQRLRKAHHNTPRIPKHVLDKQAEGSTAKMAHNIKDIPENLSGKENEKLAMKFPGSFEDFVNAQNEKLAKEQKIFHGHFQGSFQDNTQDNSHTSLEQFAEQVEQNRTKHHQVIKELVELDKEAKPLMKPPTSMKLTPRNPVLLRMLAASHTTATPPTSAPSQVMAAPQTTGATDRVAVSRPAVGATHHGAYVLDDSSDDKLPHGRKVARNVDRNKVPERTANPTANPQAEADAPQFNTAKGKKRSRGEFELDLTPEPALWELEGNKRLRANATIAPVESPNEPGDTPIKVEGAERRRAFEKEHNCIPNMRLNSEKRKKSQYDYDHDE
ncbi:hypothetical protein MMC30_000109 [Trapelia coarctata]|nr:hypothetical protein [Trapelia coarctata]